MCLKRKKLKRNKLKTAKHYDKQIVEMIKVKIEGAIFDLDGTLLDSLSVWDDLAERYLKSRGITPLESIRSDVKDQSLLECAKYFKKVYGIEDGCEEIIRGINKMIEDFYLNKAMIKDGSSEFLKYLKDRGVKMCIATATEKYLVEGAIKRCGCEKYFDAVFSCNDTKTSKHSPEIFNKALEFLGTEKKNTWIFEDALYAVKTAKAAGFNVCGLYEKYETEGDKVKELSDIYLQNFNEAGVCFD